MWGRRNKIFEEKLRDAVLPIEKDVLRTTSELKRQSGVIYSSIVFRHTQTVGPMYKEEHNRTQIS